MSSVNNTEIEMYMEEVKKLQEKYGIKTDLDGAIILGSTEEEEEEVKCEDCGKTVCEVGATKQSCRIKAFWVKWEAEGTGSSGMKACCSDCVGMGGWVEWVGEEGVEEEALCEICTADCSIQLLYGIGCCSTHIGYFCGVCIADNEEICLDCGSAFSTENK